MGIATRTFALYAYFSGDDLGNGITYKEQSRQTKGSFIFVFIFDIYMISVLIWMLWKVRFIKIAINKLKYSDEFNGENYDESDSSSCKKRVKEQKEKEKEEKKKKKKDEDEGLYDVFDEIAEKLKKYKDFGCQKKSNKNRHEIENIAEVDIVEVQSDSEMRYQNMCRFMHPKDFLAYKDIQNQSRKSQSMNDFDNLNASQFVDYLEIQEKKKKTQKKRSIGKNYDKFAEDAVMQARGTNLFSLIFILLIKTQTKMYTSRR